jgi:peptide methionine sulfoxide reductase MsrA
MGKLIIFFEFFDPLKLRKNLLDVPRHYKIAVEFTTKAQQE